MSVNEPLRLSTGATILVAVAQIAANYRPPLQFKQPKMASARYEDESVSVQTAETLLTLTEISVAVLGFAGVLAVMKGSQREVIPGVNQWRLQVLVIFGTNAIAFSLVPVLLLAMDYPDNIIWPLGSSLSSVLLLAWLIWAFRKQKKYFASYLPGQTRWNDILSSVVCICSVGAGVDNLFSEGLFKQGFAGYLWSIAAWFYVALMAFLRSILTIDLGGNSN